MFTAAVDLLNYFNLYFANKTDLFNFDLMSNVLALQSCNVIVVIGFILYNICKQFTFKHLISIYF